MSDTNTTANHRYANNDGHSLIGSALRNESAIAHHGVTASKQTVKEINAGFKALKDKQHVQSN